MSDKTASDTPQGGLLVFARRQQSIILALLVGGVVFAFLTSGQLTAQNMLLSWDVGVVCYLAMTWFRMLRAEPHHIRARASALDFSDSLLLILTVGSAIASLACIGIELHGLKDAPPDEALGRGLIAAATILVSWTFLHTLFTGHYAHHFYADIDDKPGSDGGLGFPDKIEEPIYWDFFYFAFVIGVAAQTADVGVTSTSMRKIALAHSVLSFFFNTTILALAINVGAGLL